MGNWLQLGDLEKNNTHFSKMSIDEVCTFWETGGGYFFNEFTAGHWYQNLTLASWLGNGVVGGIIYLNKDLKHVHPMKLFMLIALIDSIMFWLLFMMPYICDLDLHRLLTYTVFYTNDE